MGKIALYLVLLLSALSSVKRPWVGIIVAYLFVLLNPQSIWFWSFGSVRPVYWTLVPTILGLFFAHLKGELDLSPLKNRTNLFFALMFLGFWLSYLLGPYINIDKESYTVMPTDELFSLVWKIFLLYFMACVCIDHPKKLDYLVLSMIVSAIYLIYWANDQYLSGMQLGRMHGPIDIFGNGIYKDENAFAMFFVTSLPYLFYSGFFFRNKLLRYGLWAIIPFGWHAIFLTASRGGLVGLLVTLLVITLRSQKKLIGLMMILLFALAYAFQAGDIMKERAATISEYEQESSASSRIEAWTAAWSMVKSHPVTGVGIGRFVLAFPYFSSYQPREAHNTFLQIAAESGILAGLMYLLIITSHFSILLKTNKILKTPLLLTSHHSLFLINEATIAAFSGLITCSLFLSLQIFEIFYFVSVIINATRIICSKLLVNQLKE